MARRWAGLGLALSVALGFVACAAGDEDADPTPADPASVLVSLGSQEVVIGDGSCVWYEGSRQLVVEVGDSEGADYLLLAAPLDWLGEELPEGPAEAAELTLRLGGSDLAVDQASLEGVMNTEQTAGAFLGQLADGSPISGEWTCPEVLEE